MGLSKEEIRELVGDTFESSSSNPEFWLNQALMFNSAANILYKNHKKITVMPFLFNAAISIELAIKAVIVTQKLKPPKTHNLIKLFEAASVETTEKQRHTLELLTEIILWLGKYPVPKNSAEWNKYKDQILEKHLVREQEGNAFRTLTNTNTFPTPENYKLIWTKIMKKFTEFIENDL